VTAALRVENLHVVRSSRAGRFTLDVRELSLDSGEVLAVLGPNGSGKSTLLRVLAGLESPAAGRVTRKAAGPVTMVFQRPIAFAGTVDHNVRIALRSIGVNASEIRHRVDDALGHFGIIALAERRADRLSGGELRRLALARAFALEPAVLLLDEPFDDLDHDAQESLALDLRQAIARTGIAVAVVTHDLRRAVAVSDRIAVLCDGALQQVDSRRNVLERPCSPSVARLVGMTNLVAATLGEHASAVVDAEHCVPTPGAGAPGTPVWIGIRPEHLKVDVGRGEGESIGKAVVESIASDSVLTTLSLRWAGTLLRTHLVAGRGLAREITTGDAVSLSVRTEDVHVLPRDPRSASDPVA
jgi:ABC-type Fe3+/spermidine/putrescine transport system ATPase subunit